MLRQLRCTLDKLFLPCNRHASCIAQIVFCTGRPAVNAYLLGLLAMIKCSICSYQCDNWYVSNWRLACHIYFSLGKCALELAQGPSRVALAWHIAGGSSPFGVTVGCGKSYLWLMHMNMKLNCGHKQSWLVPVCMSSHPLLALAWFPPLDSFCNLMTVPKW